MASLSNRLTANKRFEFASAAFAVDKFEVVNMEGFESISQPFRFTLTLVSDDADVDFDAMLQNPASFTIFTPDGASRTPYFGVLAEFEQLHRADGYVFYRAVLVPRLWRLSLYRISEVYLNEQTIPAIVEKVLKNSRLSAADYELKLTGQYRTRSFVCQYQETYLDFLSRWMEKEGMYYYFEHDLDSQKDKLVIADHRRMHSAQSVAVSYRPADELDTGVAADAVQVFVCRQKPLPYQVVLQDFNHRKAALELKAQAIVSENGIGDVMIYGENFRDLEEGDRYARLRAEEIMCGGKVYSGESTAVGLRSGFFMTLSQHYRDSFNGQYLVTELHHQGSQAGALLNGLKTPFNDTGSGGNSGGETRYSNSFRAIPEAVQFRAERNTPKPRVAGTMNATIDGEGSGDYAELDEYGQYKVQLPFDQTDKNAAKGSARVRMATPYSGSNHGMHFPLHKNAEVLLSFTDGDPDQPVIMGAVPNSENRSIINQNNQHDNRISTKGGNQLHMGDTKGKEVIWLNSPFHFSSIGIGSVDPNGGGSIFAATKGSSDSVSFGNSNSMSFGSKNSLSAGTASSLDLSFANKVAIGASTSVNMSNDIKWNLNLVPFIDKIKSLTIDDSDSIKFDKTESSQLSLESHTIAAGHEAFDPKIIDLKATKTVLKRMIAAFTTANLASSTVFSLGVNGQLKSPNEENAIDKRRAASKKERDKKKKKELDDLDTKSKTDREKIVQKYKDLKAADIAAIEKKYEGKTDIDDQIKRAAEIAKVNMVTYVIAERDELKAFDDNKEKTTDAINKKYADLEAIDKSGMEDDSSYEVGMVGGWPGVISKFGTDAIFNTAALVTIQGYASKLAKKIKNAQDSLNSKIVLDKDAIEMTSKSSTAAGKTILNLSHENGGAMYVSFSKRVYVTDKATGISHQNQIVKVNEKSALMKCGETGEVLLDSNGATVKAGASSLKMTSSDVKMATGGSKMEMAAADIKMDSSGSSIEIAAKGITASAPGGTSVELGPAGVTISGQIIRIG